MPFHAEFLTGVVCALVMAGCGTKADGGATAAKSAEPSTAATKAATQQAGDEAPPAEKTGGEHRVRRRLGDCRNTFRAS